MAITQSAVALWTDSAGTPERLFWSGRRYRVTDTPTLVEIEWAAFTHPPEVPRTWRFQGSSDDGDVRVFDVRYLAEREEWQVVRTYC